MDFHAVLRGLAPAEADKVVFVTANAYTEGARRFLDELENPCLEKPFDPEALRAFTRERIR